MPTDALTITPYSLNPTDTFVWKSVDKSSCLVKIAIRVLAIITIPFELLGRLFANTGIAIYNLFQETPDIVLSEHVSRRAQLVLTAKNETSSKPLTKEVSALKLCGTLYGQSIGDALGVFTEFLSTAQAQIFNSHPIEFSDRDRYSKITEHHAKHVNRFPRDGWTDDTDQMVLIGCAEQESRLTSTASKEQLMARQIMNWRNHGLNGFSSIAGHSFPSRQDDSSADSYRKKIGCQGLGAMTSKVLQKSDFTNDPHLAALTVWKESNEANNHAVQKRDAANGALMRTSILGVIYKDNLNQAISETIRYAKVTHADPRCIASSVALTVAIALLNTGADPADALKHAETIAAGVLFDEMYAVKEHLISQEREQWREIAQRFKEEMHDCMHAPLTQLKLGVEPIGYTFKSLGAAFYALREAARLMGEADPHAQTVFRTVIEAVIFQGGDADTNAAPAAALVGAYLGEEAIPFSWRAALHLKDKAVIEQQIAAIEKSASVQPLSPEAQRDKARGAAYGQAIGDGLGLFTEFMGLEEAQKAKIAGLEFSHRVNFNHRSCVSKFPEGGWTDDTDQMLLINRAEWEYFKDQRHSKEIYLARQLRNWLHHGLSDFSSASGVSFSTREDPKSTDSHRKKIACEDVGVLTRSVIKHPQFLTNPHAAALLVWKNTSKGVELRSAANGALMRTSILGVIYRNNINQVVQETIRYAKVTHVDPRSVASAVALTVAIAHLLTGSTLQSALYEAEETAVGVLYSEIEQVKEHLTEKEANNWKQFAHNFERELRTAMNPKSLSALELGVQPIGYTFKCLGAAFYAARKALRAVEKNPTSPENIFRSLIEEIIFEGGDADTNAAAAAPLLGAFLGESAIPESWKNGLHPQDKIVMEEAITQAETIAKTVS